MIKVAFCTRRGVEGDGSAQTHPHVYLVRIPAARGGLGARSAHAQWAMMMWADTSHVVSVVTVLSNVTFKDSRISPLSSHSLEHAHAHTHTLSRIRSAIPFSPEQISAEFQHGPAMTHHSPVCPVTLVSVVFMSLLMRPTPRQAL